MLAMARSRSEYAELTRRLEVARRERPTNVVVDLLLQSARLATTAPSTPTEQFAEEGETSESMTSSEDGESVVPGSGSASAERKRRRVGKAKRILAALRQHGRQPRSVSEERRERRSLKALRALE